MTTATAVDPNELTTGPDDEVLMPNDRAKRLYPVLSEYAAKLGTISETVDRIRAQNLGSSQLQARVPEVARLICLQDVLDRRVRPILGVASTLLDHAKMDPFIADELALRWEELEEQYRFSKVAIASLVELMGGNMGAVRKLIEKAGRYKSPV